jgi:dipeptidyl aminopeptidase/acylaminoacyl peptidase
MGNINEDLSRSVKICDIDFAKQSFWQLDFDEKNNILYFVSDTENLEDFNIFTLNIGTNLVEQITHNKYTQMYDLTADKKYLIYSNQIAHTKDGYESKVYLLNLHNGQRKEIYETSSDYKVTWSGVTMSKDEKSIIFTVDYKSKRIKKNLLLLDIETGEEKLLLKKEDESSLVYGPLEESFENDFTFVSNIEGVENFYRYNIENQKVNKISLEKSPLKGMSRIKKSNDFVLLNNDLKNDQTLVRLVNFSNEELIVKQSKALRGNYDLKSNDLGIILIRNNIDSPSTFIHFDDELNPTGLEIAFYIGKEDELANCTYSFEEYQSFDGSKVPAFVIHPKGEVKGAMVTSFYGGDNYYSLMYNMVAEMGIAVLSPAVRGSSGHGKEWRDKIIGDLGGDEILDVIWGARFIKDKFGLKENQVGVFGGSHGGFATLRALTMPNPYNGVDTSFDFGAGICTCGFADLKDFYETSNIPDWLVQMLGEFDEEKYASRSPVNFFENLNSPLLVVHGTNDRRVSATSMEGFLEKLKNSDKNYEVLISEGQGHHTNDKELLTKEFNLKLDFLSKNILKG